MHLGWLAGSPIPRFSVADWIGSVVVPRTGVDRCLNPNKVPRLANKAHPGGIGLGWSLYRERLLSSTKLGGKILKQFGTFFPIRLDK